jgi:hypothetical protein
MHTSDTQTIPRAVRVQVTDEDLLLELADGRRLTVPLSWYPRLANATPKQRRAFRLIGGGIGIRWPAVDEDLSVAGLLRGNRAPPGSEHWRSDLLPKRKR